MKTNWEGARYAGEQNEPLALNVTLLRWLCGCGRSTPFMVSKAYPVCHDCHRRMLILDYPKLSYKA